MFNVEAISCGGDSRQEHPEDRLFGLVELAAKHVSKVRRDGWQDQLAPGDAGDRGGQLRSETALADQAVGLRDHSRRGQRPS